MNDRTLSRANIEALLNERTERGFTLTAQEAQARARRVLGKSESLYPLIVRERTERRWPHEATDIIMEFTERALAQGERRSEGERRNSALEKEADKDGESE